MVGQPLRIHCNDSALFMCQRTECESKRRSMSFTVTSRIAGGGSISGMRRKRKDGRIETGIKQLQEGETLLCNFIIAPVLLLSDTFDIVLGSSADGFEVIWFHKGGSGEMKLSREIVRRGVCRGSNDSKSRLFPFGIAGHERRDCADDVLNRRT